MLAYSMVSIFPFLFMIVFVLILGTFIVMAINGARTWHRNNQSPVLTVEASVVTKRQRVSRHQNHHATTYYYATFQVESGDRMELSVTGKEYGLLAEGDRGKLTFQGMRYLGFDRI